MVSHFDLFCHYSEKKWRRHYFALKKMYKKWNIFFKTPFRKNKMIFFSPKFNYFTFEFHWNNQVSYKWLYFSQNVNIFALGHKLKLFNDLYLQTLTMTSLNWCFPISWLFRCGFKQVTLYWVHSNCTCYVAFEYVHKC